MQVIASIAIAPFINGLGLNRRVNPKVAAGTSDSDSVMLQVAEAFQKSQRPHSERLTREENNERLRNFYTKDCHVRACFDNSDMVGGFIVLNGELLALHNTERGKGDWMMRDAIKLGAVRCNSFDLPALVDLYLRNGWHEVSRVPNWVPGEPDVIYWER